MNENKMLNDKPIFVAKSRTSHGLILAATCLMFALVIYFLSQESEADVIDWVGIGFFGIGVVFVFYETLIFKKIMLFDDRIEVHCLNKVIVRAYSQIESFVLLEWYVRKGFTNRLKLECEPYFMHSYLDGVLLHKNELYKIKEILIKKGVKDNSCIIKEI
ncbi:MAG: hypothetical protein MR658_06050 [Campylobacter sp.]|uniref:hypothetical protein n=1 Tax=Campylobacter sp. TaxID=205 RepID=UPI002AA64771|nr:hypothetical protein [Campylobacter sp.]MCI6178370.1 hypothetical protein [Campylobacter sp.]